MEEDHFRTFHKRASLSASRSTSSSCSPSPPVEVIIFPNNSPSNNAADESGSDLQSFEDFYQGQINRRRSQVQALKLQRAQRTSSFVTAATATSTAASTSNMSRMPQSAAGRHEMGSVGSGGWRNRIISRYTSSMLELSTMAKNRNIAKNMQNATWDENNNEDAKHSSSLLSTRQIIHQNRERLFMGLLRPTTSCELLSSHYVDPSSIQNQGTDDISDQLLLDTITTDSALSLRELILARRVVRKKSIASLRELHRKPDPIPVMIHHQHQEQAQGTNADITNNSSWTEYTANRIEMPTVTTTSAPSL